MGKKILIGILAVTTMIGSFTACGGADGNSGTNKSDTTSGAAAGSSDDKNATSGNLSEDQSQNGMGSASKRVEELGVHNPRDPETKELSFSYVYFGSYPQTEIAAEKTKKTKADINPELFAKLQATKDWDSNNDTVIDGVKYRRCNGDYVYQMRTTYIHGDDTRYADESDYKWFSDKDPDTYHYFRYEPVKWRVYEVNENDLLLTSS